MTMIVCKECNKEISSKAKACPSCGASQGGGAGKVLLIMVGVCALLIVGVIAIGSSSKSEGSYTAAEMCDQSAEAAHYIAAMSASSDDVARVTSQVIADRKYPILGDQVTASIGAVVALSRGLKTPDEISDDIKARCEKQNIR